jgi:hypothetical protein
MKTSNNNGRPGFMPYSEDNDKFNDAVSDAMTGRATRVYAWYRKETESCQAGTRSCSIDHNRDHGGCHIW